MFKNILRRTAPGLESKLWEEAMDIEALWPQAHLALNRIAYLLPIADAVLREEHSAPPSSESLLHAIGLLEAEDQNFRTWSIRHGSLSVQNGLSESSQSVTSQNDYFANSLWNVHRAGRIFLLQTLLTWRTEPFYMMTCSTSRKKCKPFNFTQMRNSQRW